MDPHVNQPLLISNGHVQPIAAKGLFEEDIRALAEGITNMSLAMLHQHELGPYPRGGGRQKNQWQVMATCFNCYECGHIALDCLHRRRRGGEMSPILCPLQPN